MVQAETEELAPNSEWSHALTDKLDAGAVGFPLLAYDEIDSTSDMLRNMAQAGAPEGTCIVAGAQRRGRGQHGRTWYSKAGLGAYFSVLLKPHWKRSDMKWISPMAAVAVAHAMKSLGLEDVTLKKPNDIMAHDKKIAGLLIETRLGKYTSHFAMIGIGINVSHKEDQWPEGLRHPVTSFCMEGINASCDEVVLRVLNTLDQYYRQASMEGPEFLDEHWFALTGEHPFDAG